MEIPTITGLNTRARGEGKCQDIREAALNFLVEAAEAGRAVEKKEVIAYVTEQLPEAHKATINIQTSVTLRTATLLAEGEVPTKDNVGTNFTPAVEAVVRERFGL